LVSYLLPLLFLNYSLHYHSQKRVYISFVYDVKTYVNVCIRDAISSSL